MSLPTHQQSLLNGMDRGLEVRDPGLASLFAIFNRLTSSDGPPRAERLRPCPGSLGVALRWTRASAAIPIFIVVALMAAIIALGVATSGGRVCPSAATVHLSGQSGQSGYSGYSRYSGHSGLAGCQAAIRSLKLARYRG